MSPCPGCTSRSPEGPCPRLPRGCGSMAASGVLIRLQLCGPPHPPTAWETDTASVTTGLEDGGAPGCHTPHTCVQLRFAHHKGSTPDTLCNPGKCLPSLSPSVYPSGHWTHSPARVAARVLQSIRNTWEVAERLDARSDPRPIKSGCLGWAPGMRILWVLFSRFPENRKKKKKVGVGEGTEEQNETGEPLVR